MEISPEKGGCQVNLHLLGIIMKKLLIALILVLAVFVAVTYMFIIGKRNV